MYCFLDNPRVGTKVVLKLSSGILWAYSLNGSAAFFVFDIDVSFTDRHQVKDELLHTFSTGYVESSPV